MKTVVAALVCFVFFQIVQCQDKFSQEGINAIENWPDKLSSTTQTGTSSYSSTHPPPYGTRLYSINSLNPTTEGIHKNDLPGTIQYIPDFVQNVPVIVQSTPKPTQQRPTSANLNKKNRDQPRRNSIQNSQRVTQSIPKISSPITLINNELPVVIQSSPKPTAASPKVQTTPKLVCPGKEIRRPFFALRCQFNKDCRRFGGGSELVCCDNRCILGVPPPTPEPKHTPTFFGLVERICPTDPVPEFREIKTCNNDIECTPRICCPERLLNGTLVGFCRIASPKLNSVPLARRFMEPLQSIMSYMQCTPPPPPLLDIFPKPCKSALDCFPNLCCQEKGQRYCRPPKRSLLSLVAGVSQRVIPTDAARRFITRITS